MGLRPGDMQGPPTTVTPRNPDNNVAAPGNNSRRREPTVDVTYHAVVPPPREKHLANVRKQHNPKSRSMTSGRPTRKHVRCISPSQPKSHVERSTDEIHSRQRSNECRAAVRRGRRVGSDGRR